MRRLIARNFDWETQNCGPFQHFYLKVGASAPLEDPPGCWPNAYCTVLGLNALKSIEIQIQIL